MENLMNKELVFHFIWKDLHVIFVTTNGGFGALKIMDKSLHGEIRGMEVGDVAIGFVENDLRRLE